MPASTDRTAGSAESSSRTGAASRPFVAGGCGGGGGEVSPRLVGRTEIASRGFLATTSRGGSSAITPHAVCADRGPFHQRPEARAPHRIGAAGTRSEGRPLSGRHVHRPVLAIDA